jgi:hypothetical protein
MLNVVVALSSPLARYRPTALQKCQFFLSPLQTKINASLSLQMSSPWAYALKLFTQAVIDTSLQ